MTTATTTTPGTLARVEQAQTVLAAFADATSRTLAAAQFIPDPVEQARTLRDVASRAGQQLLSVADDLADLTANT